ncbi:MAG: hypothetical protein ACI95T_001537 [Flavobacteriales bacterium]|jgi:hypothetical protein
MEKTIKIILSTMLFICLLDMPYSYYQLVRFVSMLVFVFLGFKELEKENQNIAYLYFGLAILFQPFLKIALGRELWNLVDVVVGIWLMISAFRSDKNHPNNPN